MNRMIMFLLPLLCVACAKNPIVDIDNLGDYSYYATSINKTWYVGKGCGNIECHSDDDAAGCSCETVIASGNGRCVKVDDKNSKCQCRMTWPREGNWVDFGRESHQYCDQICPNVCVLNMRMGFKEFYSELFAPAD